MMQRIALATTMSVTALTLAACGARTPVAEPAPVQPQVQAAAGPSIFISAPGQRVRSVIASRAQSRGTTVASNTPQGVVLERALAQSTETLEAQCGPHASGRIIRVVLSTQDGRGSTTVSESRFVVDGANVCPIELPPAEVAQANAGLQEIRDQVLGVPPRAATAPVAPATPRT